MLTTINADAKNPDATRTQWPVKLSAHPWSTLLLALAAILVMAPLLIRLTLPGGSDTGMHLFNAQLFAREIRSGVLYPRWLGDWYEGYGAPIGIAYPPLTYMGFSLLSIVGFSPTAAYLTLFWLSIFVSGFLLYRLARQFIAPFGALVAALFYEIAPYRFFDLYKRGAYPEFLSFMWLPLVALLIVYCARRRSIFWPIALALSVATFILVHLPIALLFMLAMLPFALYLMARAADPKMALARLMAAGSLGLMLAAFYLLPAFQESRFMNTAYLEHLTPGFFPPGQDWANYLNNFLFNVQVYIGTQSEDTYKTIGEAGVSAGLIVAVGVVALFGNLRHWSRREPAAREMALVMAGVLGICIFMSLSISQPVWALIPRIATIQFPMRWLTVATLAAAYLVGDVASLMVLSRSLPVERPGQSSMDRLSRWVLPAVFLIIIVANVGYTVLEIRNDISSLNTSVVARLSGKQPLQIDDAHWVFDDYYKPTWSLKFDYYGAPVTDLTRVSDDPSSASASKIDIQAWQSDQRLFTVSRVTSGMVNIRTFWFPGWEAEVNGQAVPITIRADDGTMLVPVSAGDSKIALRFKDTPIRSIGWALSLLALLIVIGGAIVTVATLRRHCDENPLPSGSGG